MTPIATMARRRAANPLLASCVADPLQLHAEAHNALAMALHYLRQPSSNIPGATRKAVQALAALGRLQDIGPDGAPTAASGRA